MSENEISAGITGFIDILGFSEKVLSAKTTEDVIEIKGQLKTIQEEFNHNSKDGLVNENSKYSKKEVLAFSDSIIVNIPLESDSTTYHGTFDPIMSELAGFAYSQGTCVSQGIFIRGGIDLGWWFHDEHILISDSLTRAYKLEGRANVPVIALTPELYEYFSNHSHRGFYSRDIDPLAMFKKYDESGTMFWFIDYLEICLDALGWQRSKKQIETYHAASIEEKDIIMNEGYALNSRDWLCNHARQIEAAYSEVESSNYSNDVKDKIKGKYLWLSRYHNDVAALYKDFADCICKLPQKHGIEV